MLSKPADSEVLHGLSNFVLYLAVWSLQFCIFVSLLFNVYPNLRLQIAQELYIYLYIAFILACYFEYFLHFILHIIHR